MVEQLLPKHKNVVNIPLFIKRISDHDLMSMDPENILNNV